MSNLESTDETIQNLQEGFSVETDDEGVSVEMEGDSYIEQLLKATIKGYELNFNKFNDKVEAKFLLTITVHKIPRPEGNKDVAYLRLDKHIKDKGAAEDTYIPQLVTQATYMFKDLKERLNPHNKWKEQLYLDCLARLIGAGLEYGELMRRMKAIQEAQAKMPSEEERLADIGLVKADAMPTPLTPDEENYKTWVENERKKEGL